MIATPEPDGPELFTSPDGRLALRITPDVEGETMVSFHGFDWAIGGSQLAESYSLQPDAAIEAYVHSILQDEAIIAVLILDDEMVDVWITEYPLSDLECCNENERLIFRRWSGTLVALDQQ